MQRRRATRTGDLSGRDVRRPVRRLRRLPGVRQPTQYRLRDTKLARSVKVEALLQLAAYADTLAATGVPVAHEVELVLGDGATASYRVDELLPVYLPRRAALQRLLDDHLAGGTAVSWEDDEVRACFRCPECAIQVRATTTCCSWPACGSASAPG